MRGIVVAINYTSVRCSQFVLTTEEQLWWVFTVHAPVKRHNCIVNLIFQVVGASAAGPVLDLCCVKGTFPTT